MSDPERLRTRPANTLTGALMRAGLTERPNEAVVRRTLKAVATFAGFASTSGAATAVQLARGSAAGLSPAASAALTTPALIAKWLVIGAGSGVLISLGVHQSMLPSAPTAAPNAPGAPQVSVPARPGTSTPHPIAPGPSEERSVVVDSEAKGRSEQSARTSAGPVFAPSNSATPRAPENTVAAELAAEVALVDRARELLSGNDARGALGALHGYEGRFPRLQLYTEVLALRMEASHAIGNEADTRLFAERLLARGAPRPLADRARRLLDE